MQTFLPYKSFKKSARCLDNKRLGKQRVEAMQILDVLCTSDRPRKGWSNHPAVLQWKGCEAALFAYLLAVQEEWERRDFNGDGISLHIERRLRHYRQVRATIGIVPSWLGKKKFHDSHKSRLLQKNPNWYEQFGWSVPLDLEYVWPVRKEKP